MRSELARDFLLCCVLVVGMVKLRLMSMTHARVASIYEILEGSRKQLSLADTSLTSALEVIFIMRCAT